MFLGALVAAGVGWGLVAWRHSVDATRLEAANGADLEWIREEFHLDDQQYAGVLALHEAYRPICAKHCADIADALARLAALRAAGASAEEIASAESAISDFEAVCNNATREHVRRVAAAMPRDQGRRYLQMVEPHLAHTPHDPALRDGLSR